MKKLTFLVLCIAFFISGCKKDDTRPDNYFEVNTRTVPVTYAYAFNANTYVLLSFADKHYLSTSFTGQLSLVSFQLDTLISNQTYTFLSTDSPAYDRTKNFGIVTTIDNANVNKGEIDGSTGTVFFSPEEGRLDIKQQGQIYTITYHVKYANTTLTGTYSGRLEMEGSPF